ncbi:septum formation protein [Bhargavaea beijingensis]|uniref:dTTP/UTP pyrophosphatase n=1 Tax=Bhargavaea beijingensis TaxID=426756 RepID=A0A1G7D0N1_9BACL|nr:Maf family protein [Bhargavaea beijingensis]SDE45043.1 septum formation protein [Bhargavaea beijingensis]
MEFKTNRQVVLASGSPRRSELMGVAGIPFIVRKPQVQEPPIRQRENPANYAERLAALKARDVAEREPGAVVIGADTVVHQEGRAYGKPSGREEAKAFLESLCGSVHSVSTGVCVTDGELERTFSVTTDVEFREAPHWLIDRYVDSGDPMDKAGAYGIQSGGALFVKGIRGDYYAVVGLPIADMFEVLDEMGVISAGKGDGL